MRRNRKNSVKKERLVMLVSSALVLTALTLTGIYMQTGEKQTKDDGYTLDFTAIEENTENKLQEITQNNEEIKTEDIRIGGNGEIARAGEWTQLDDDLDYMPLEAGSGDVRIPGLTENKAETKNREIENHVTEPAAGDSLTSKLPEDTTAEDIPSTTQSIEVVTEMHFDIEKGLSRPLEGEVLIPFSMDNSVYFSTLDQYKYNPALILVATENMTVAACAPGRVTDIFEDAQIGHALTVDLGDGYQLTYGQLKNISVSLGETVIAGETLGAVATPTKYFSKEGSNLYLKLTADGVPINPESMFLE